MGRVARRRRRWRSSRAAFANGRARDAEAPPVAAASSTAQQDATAHAAATTVQTLVVPLVGAGTTEPVASHAKPGGGAKSSVRSDQRGQLCERDPNVPRPA
mmetsp:Transcript_8349/g.26099  ORF Transcript_8349/g.26099 Transcript_8349/m.26099 type:complete len:101 (+) Transcript_8349:643-945(+)